MKGRAGIASVLLIAAAIVGSLSPVPARGASPPATSIQASDVVAHLEQTIGWYRRISTDEPSTGVPGDILFREATQQNSTKALQLAFDFARAEAAILGSNPGNSSQPQQPGGGGTKSRRGKSRRYKSGRDESRGSGLASGCGEGRQPCQHAAGSHQESRFRDCEGFRTFPDNVDGAAERAPGRT